MSCIRQLPRSITATQRKVVDLLWAGHRVRVIAKLLGMEVSTVRAHIRTVAAQLANPHDLPAVRLIRTFDPANIDRAAEDDL